jgi:uncharacterized membrane protein YfcA
MIDLVILLAAAGLAGLAHSAAGFGAALVAMPILTLLFDVKTAASIVALQGLITSSTVLIQNRHGLDFREATLLILASLVGIPIGFVLSRRVDQGLVTGALGILLIAYALYTLWDNSGAPREMPDDRPVNSWQGAGGLAAGFLAGILGGAYNTNGPPLIVYGAIRRWPPARFKSILQSLFLSNGLVVVAVRAAGGAFTPQVLTNYLYSIPTLLVGLLLGTRFSRRWAPEQFRRLILLLILILGILLLVA